MNTSLHNELRAIEEGVLSFVALQEHRERGCTFRGDLCVECGASRLTDEDRAEEDFYKESE